MADIEVKCPACGKSLMVSEFVDFDALRCRACGGKLTPSATLSAAGGAASLYRMKPPEAEPARPAADVAGAPAAGENLARLMRRRKDPQAGRKRMPAIVVASWIIFVVLGGIMGVLRYGDVGAATTFIKGSHFGLILILIMHVVIILKAFRDSVFQGVLCFLIPFYSLYYIIVVSDDFILRACVAGGLVGIGQDSAVLFQQTASRTIESVHQWIAAGGG